MKNTNERIVKVIRSGAGEDGIESVLVFDQKKEFMYQGLMPMALKKMLNGKHKTYCEAELIPRGDEEGNFEFHIIKEIEDQKW